MADEDPLIVDAIAKLEAEDAGAARDAEAAIEWLTAGEGLEGGGWQDRSYALPPPPAERSRSNAFTVAPPVPGRVPGADVANRRPPIFGPEPWAERAGAGWSHWDLWFCLVCLIETESDWAALEEEIIAWDRRRSVTSRTWERKCNHLLDLRARLDAAGLFAADLATDALDDKALRTKARRTCSTRSSPAATSHQRWRTRPGPTARARPAGHWPEFPVSPTEDLLGVRRSGRCRAPELPVGHGAGGHRNRGDRGASDPARQLALWRAVLTAGLEAFLRGLRDSDGAVDTILGDALDTYARLPWRETGINPAVYWADLCEWCIWEDWGTRHQRDTVAFRGARKSDVELVEQTLLGLEAEHRSHRLDHEADEALQLVAWLAVATRSSDRFIPAVERLRADWWMPVDTMGEVAAMAGKLDLAADVYGTAIAGGGRHVDYLTRLCRQRTGNDAASRRHLRAVD